MYLSAKALGNQLFMLLSACKEFSSLLATPLDADLPKKDDFIRRIAAEGLSSLLLGPLLSSCGKEMLAQNLSPASLRKPLKSTVSDAVPSWRAAFEEHLLALADVSPSGLERAKQLMEGKARLTSLAPTTAAGEAIVRGIVKAYIEHSNVCASESSKYGSLLRRIPAPTEEDGIRSLLRHPPSRNERDDDCESFGPLVKKLLLSPSSQYQMDKIPSVGSMIEEELSEKEARGFLMDCPTTTVKVDRDVDHFCGTSALGGWMKEGDDEKEGFLPGALFSALFMQTSIPNPDTRVYPPGGPPMTHPLPSPSLPVTVCGGNSPCSANKFVYSTTSTRLQLARNVLETLPPMRFPGQRPHPTLAPPQSSPTNERMVGGGGGGGGVKNSQKLLHRYQQPMPLFWSDHLVQLATGHYLPLTKFDGDPHNLRSSGHSDPSSVLPPVSAQTSYVAHSLLFKKCSEMGAIAASLEALGEKLLSCDRIEGEREYKNRDYKNNNNRNNYEYDNPPCEKNWATTSTGYCVSRAVNHAAQGALRDFLRAYAVSIKEFLFLCGGNPYRGELKETRVEMEEAEEGEEEKRDFSLSATFILSYLSPWTDSLESVKLAFLGCIGESGALTKTEINSLPPTTTTTTTTTTTSSPKDDLGASVSPPLLHGVPLLEALYQASKNHPVLPNSYISETRRMKCRNPYSNNNTSTSGNSSCPPPPSSGSVLWAIFESVLETALLLPWRKILCLPESRFHSSEMDSLGLLAPSSLDSNSSHDKSLSPPTLLLPSLHTLQFYSSAVIRLPSIPSFLCSPSHSGDRRKNNLTRLGRGAFYLHQLLTFSPHPMSQVAASYHRVFNLRESSSFSSSSWMSAAGHGRALRASVEALQGWVLSLLKGLGEETCLGRGRGVVMDAETPKEGVRVDDEFSKGGYFLCSEDRLTHSLLLSLLGLRDNRRRGGEALDEKSSYNDNNNDDDESDENKKGVDSLEKDGGLAYRETSRDDERLDDSILTTTTDSAPLDSHRGMGTKNRHETEDGSLMALVPSHHLFSLHRSPNKRTTQRIARAARRASEAAQREALILSAKQSLLERYGGYLEKAEEKTTRGVAPLTSFFSGSHTAKSHVSESQAKAPDESDRARSMTREQRSLTALSHLSPKGKSMAHTLINELKHVPGLVVGGWEGNNDGFHRVGPSAAVDAAPSIASCRGSSSSEDDEQEVQPQIFNKKLPVFSPHPSSSSSGIQVDLSFASSPLELPAHIQAVHIEPLLKQASLLHTAHLACTLLLGDVFGHLAACHAWFCLGDGVHASLLLDNLLQMASATPSSSFTTTTTATTISSNSPPVLFRRVNSAWGEALVTLGYDIVSQEVAEEVNRRIQSAIFSPTSAADHVHGSAPHSLDSLPLDVFLRARAFTGVSPSLQYAPRFFYSPVKTETASTDTNYAGGGGGGGGDAGFGGSATTVVTETTRQHPFSLLCSSLLPQYSLGRLDTPAGFTTTVRPLPIPVPSTHPSLSLILTPLSLSRYASLHVFLLRVKGAGRALNSLRFLLPPRSTPPHIFLLRHTMAHVINALEGYCSHLVIGEGWRGFCREASDILRRAGGCSVTHHHHQLDNEGGEEVEDILQCLARSHDNYTAELLASCFLPPIQHSSGVAAGKVSPPHHGPSFIVRSVLDLAMEFCSLCEKLYQSTGQTSTPPPLLSATKAKTTTAATAATTLDPVVDEMNSRFASLVHTMVGGLRNTAADGGFRYSTRIQHLLERLGPVHFLQHSKSHVHPLHKRH